MDKADLLTLFTLSYAFLEHATRVRVSLLGLIQITLSLLSDEPEYAVSHTKHRNASFSDETKICFQDYCY